MKYSEIKVGDSASLQHVITHDDVIKFMMLSGDFNKLHWDTEFAEETDFKTPVVHGMLVCSYISTIIGKYLPGDGALWTSLDVKFIYPVRERDVITVVASVIKLDEDNRIKLAIDITNQDGIIVMLGTAFVKVLE